MLTRENIEAILEPVADADDVGNQIPVSAQTEIGTSGTPCDLALSA